MIKDELMDAVKETAEAYNSGMSANEAVVKTAVARDFNEKQAERLSEMFNTLAAINQETRSDNPTGSCELADKSKVRAMLMKGAEKKASVDSSVYSFYGSDPIRTNTTVEARSAGMRMEKAASDKDCLPKEMDLSLNSLYKVIDSKIDLLKSAADAADEVVRALELEIERGCVKIAKSLEAPGVPGWKADMFKAACSSRSALDAVSEYSEKVAASSGGEYADSVFDSSPVDDLLKLAEEIGSNLELVPKYKASRDFYMSKAAEAKDSTARALGLDFSAPEKGLADFFSVKAAVAPGKAADDARPQEDVDSSIKIAELIRRSGVQSGEVVRLARDLEKDAAVQVPLMMPISTSPNETMEALINRGTIDDEELKVLNARRAVLLAELMSNDPIIRDADPNMVAEAYKTMVMTSPRVSLDKAQVRAFLRGAVNSVAISPSDAKVLADVDWGTARSNIERLTAIDSSIKDSNRA